MTYPTWLYGPLGALLGILVGAVVVVLIFEVIWRRETGDRWWFLRRKR